MFDNVDMAAGVQIEMDVVPSITRHAATGALTVEREGGIQVAFSLQASDLRRPNSTLSTRRAR